MRNLLLSACVSTLFAMTAVPAAAEEFDCTGTLTNPELDNVRVPDGATCVISGGYLNGNIVVGNRARLTTSNLSVNGNVQAEGFSLVRLDPGTRVGGSVQLKQGGTVRLTSIDVDSDVQLDANRGRITAARNRIDGNMQIVGNSGGVVLNRNRIAQSLQCKENSPPPTGSGNMAGDKEDQCSAL